MSIITIKEYANKHGKAEVSVRQMAQRGGLRTARKTGRDWLVDANEPYPDRRKRVKEAFNPIAWQEDENGETPFSEDELQGMLKTVQARQYSRIGTFNETFSRNWEHMPVQLRKELTPEQLGWAVDLLADSYHEGQAHPQDRSQTEHQPQAWNMIPEIWRLIPEKLTALLTHAQTGLLLEAAADSYLRGLQNPEQ